MRLEPGASRHNDRELWWFLAICTLFHHSLEVPLLYRRQTCVVLRVLADSYFLPPTTKLISALLTHMIWPTPPAECWNHARQAQFGFDRAFDKTNSSINMKICTYNRALPKSPKAMGTRTCQPYWLADQTDTKPFNSTWHTHSPSNEYTALVNSYTANLSTWRPKELHSNATTLRMLGEPTRCQSPTLASQPFQTCVYCIRLLTPCVGLAPSQDNCVRPHRCPRASVLGQEYAILWSTVHAANLTGWPSQDGCGGRPSFETTTLDARLLHTPCGIAFPPFHCEHSNPL